MAISVFPAGGKSIDKMLIRNTVQPQKQDYVAQTHTFTIPAPAQGKKMIMVYLNLYIYHFQAGAESTGTCTIKLGNTVLASNNFHRYKTAYTDATVAALINPSVNVGTLTLTVTGTDGNFVQIKNGYIWTY